MSILSLASLDAKIESVASGVLEHIGHSLDLKDRLHKLEAGAKPDVEALKADIMGEVKSMLSDLRNEIMGDVKAEVSDNVGQVTKAMADLTTTSATDAPTEAETAPVPSPASVAPVSPVI